MLADYFREAYGLTVIEDEEFVLVYGIDYEDMFLDIKHLYIPKQYRGWDTLCRAEAICKKIVLEKRLKSAIITVDKSNLNFHYVLKTFVKVGFKIIDWYEDYIVLHMEAKWEVPDEQ